MIKKTVIKLLASKMGWLLKLVTGLIAGFVLPFIMNTMGLDLPPEKQAEIVAGIAGAVYLILQSIVLKLSLNGNKAVQKRLKEIDPALNEDRWIGDVTIKALEDAVRQSTDVVERVKGKNAPDYDEIPRAIPVKPRPFKPGGKR